MLIKQHWSMAVSLEGWWALRNGEIYYRYIDRPKPEHRLEEPDKKLLEETIRELDVLHDSSDQYEDPTPIIGPNVVLPGVTRIIDYSTNRQRSAELYEVLHQIFRRYLVSTRLYVSLGYVFEHIKITPQPDTAAAIEFAKGKEKELSIGRTLRSGRMCWDDDGIEGICGFCGCDFPLGL